VLNGAPIDIKNAREYGWLAEGHFIMHNILSGGELVQFAFCGYDEDAIGSEHRARVVTRGQLREMSSGKGWLPHLERGIEEVSRENCQKDRLIADCDDCDD
jgi:salicylate hydroxylase